MPLRTLASAVPVHAASGSIKHEGQLGVSEIDSASAGKQAEGGSPRAEVRDIHRRVGATMLFESSGAACGSLDGGHGNPP